MGKTRRSFLIGGGAVIAGAGGSFILDRLVGRSPEARSEVVYSVGAGDIRMPSFVMEGTELRYEFQLERGDVSMWLSTGSSAAEALAEETTIRDIPIVLGERVTGQVRLVDGTRYTLVIVSETNIESQIRARLSMYD